MDDTHIVQYAGNTGRPCFRRGASETAGNPPKGESFRSILLDSLNEVNRLQNEADQNVQRLLTGETDNVAEVMAAVNKAGVAFDLLMEVRNKLSDAYDEIKQMRCKAVGRKTAGVPGKRLSSGADARSDMEVRPTFA